MRRILSLVLWTLCVSQAAGAADALWQYPCRISDLSNLECDCWDAIDRSGRFPSGDAEDYLIDPRVYLVQAPPTENTAVSITADRWIEVSFSGPIVDGDGPDIRIREEGQMGESALVFLSDGKSRTYPLGIASIPDLGAPESTICEFDLHQVDPGFVPTAVRILSLGFGGGSPGFDVGSVEARIAVDTSGPHAPNPYHGADLVRPDQPLQWTASQQPDSVSVYLSTDPNETDPETGTPVRTLPGDASSFQPDEPLLLNVPYTWRVVEHHGESTRVGASWQFTVSPYLHVEDFESYANTHELLYDLDNAHSGPWLETSTASAHLSHGSDAVKAGCHGVALEYDCKNGIQARLFRYFSWPYENWTSPDAKYI